MPQIDASFTSVRTVRVDRPDTVWFATGVPSSGVVEALADGGDVEAFCATHGDAIVVRITTGDRPAVTAWKALFSSQELFWTVRPNGDVVVADHYRNIMAALPVRERAPSDLTLAAHHLSRKPHGPLTMAASVSRLQFGSRVDIDVPAGTASTTRIARVPDDADEAPKEEYLARAESALRAVVADIEDPRDTALMFSGGVDSTLILALDPAAMRAVTFVPDTPEFALETAYARQAAALVGVDLHEVPAPEDEFVAGLEAATDATGIPLFSDAGPYYHRAYATTPYGAFVDGHGADSSFGASMKLARFSNAFRFAPSRRILTALAPRTGGHLGYRLDQVASRAEGLARDPWDPDGWAGNGRTYGDVAFLTGVFGDLVDDVRVRQLAYVYDLVEGVGDAPNRFLAHLEIYHWMQVFGGPMYQGRLNTAGLGKDCIGPYCDWRVLAALATVPVEDRYVVGLQAKWMLKRLLAANLPAYPIDQRKQATALPWKRFYTDGPLRGFFDRYPVPDVFTGEARRRIVDEPMAATWTSITQAVWEDRIRSNPTLEPIAVVASASFVVGG